MEEAPVRRAARRFGGRRRSIQGRRSSIRPRQRGIGDGAPCALGLELLLLVLAVEEACVVQEVAPCGICSLISPSVASHGGAASGGGDTSILSSLLASCA
nr:unnamed protein product [Digitaria exilis]